MPAALKLTFGEPHHGWLPIHLEVGSHVIEFVASDVPNNPVQQPVDALAYAVRGEAAEVWWHLEPDGYYFRFSPSPTGVELRVLYSHHSVAQAQSEVASALGKNAEVLLPIWRALRGFEAEAYSEPHWPPVEFEKMVLIREVFRNGS
jgi:hypothetical protein